MEEAPPIICESEKPKEDDNEINFIEELKIKQDNEEYRIKFETKGNGLIIKVVSESSKEIIHYQQYYNLYDLQKILIFSAYKYVNDIINVLKELKMEIEKKNNEIIIKFNAFMPNGQKRFIKLNLKRYILNDKEMVKYALDEIISIKNNMKNKEEIYNEEKIKNENEIKKLKEIISKAEAKISKLELDNMNYKNEISNLKNENGKLWKEINQIKLNNINQYDSYNPINQFQGNAQNNNIYNNINNNNINNNMYKTQIYRNLNNNNVNQNYSQSNINPNNYNNYQNQSNPPGGMRNPNLLNYNFEILEKNPEVFIKLIDDVNQKVKFECTIINNGNKTYPGNENTKLVFFKNNLTNIGEIDLGGLQPYQKEKLNLDFSGEVFFGPINFIVMGLKIDGEFIDKPIRFKVVNKLVIIEWFRRDYKIKKEDYSDEALLNILKKYDYDLENASASLKQYRNN